MLSVFGFVMWHQEFFKDNEFINITKTVIICYFNFFVTALFYILAYASEYSLAYKAHRLSEKVDALERIINMLPDSVLISAVEPMQSVHRIDSPRNSASGAK